MKARSGGDTGSADIAGVGGDFSIDIVKFRVIVSALPVLSCV